ncbi:hypothetical protein TMatcc_004482 [Talaromyces marneffei ATCC 18224]
MATILLALRCIGDTSILGFRSSRTIFLVSNGAAFGGLVRRELLPHKVAVWNIMYQNVIPVTVYVDTCGVVVGYDFFSPVERTYESAS